MPLLGELLVQDGVCSAEQVEQAVQSQVILGGRVGTNLIEAGAIDERSLASYLGKIHGCPYLSGEIEPSTEALALVTPSQAEKLECIPYLVEGRRLQVLCTNPANLAALDEVRFITGLEPDPIVITEMRFWQLLDKCYGHRKTTRHLVLSSRDFLSASLAPEKHEPAGEQVAKGEELISEEAFAKLYQRRDGFPAVSPPPPAPEELPLLSAEDLEPEEQPQPPGRIERRTFQAEWPEERRAPPEQRRLTDESHLPEERALDFEQARKLLEGATDRHEVARIVLRYAIGLFRRAVFFGIYRDRASCIDAIGDGIEQEKLRHLSIPLSEPSIVSAVWNSRSHYLGALRKTEYNIRLLRAMGRQLPLSALAIPVLVGQRPVNVLYCDNGHRRHADSDAAELLILSQAVSACYRRLFEKRRLAFGSEPAPPGREVK